MTIDYVGVADHHAQAALAQGHGEALSGTAVSRSYMSTQHLYASWYAAMAADDEETRLLDGLRSISMRHRGAVLSSVVEAVAFVEAAINEVFQDAADDRLTYIAGLDPTCRRAMAATWNATAQGNLETLKKYDLALELASHVPFDQGASPYQDVKVLVRLRNYAIHYKPHDHRLDSPDSMVAALSGRFRPNAAAQALRAKSPSNLPLY